VKRRIAKDLDLARHVADRVRDSGELELLVEPELSICCFRYRPPGWSDEAAIDALNERIAPAVRGHGRAFPSTTRVGGRYAIRPFFINPRTRLEDADALVDEVIACGRLLTADA
jgi:glutamate/tyrosine decarboxylase-like PLP-dependent enzyme